jgi:DNA invertase Pin-like site-specific DNA recombinase
MTGTHPQNRRLGYARVNTYGQTLDAQLEQLRGAGCPKIYREKVTARTTTGASFSRCSTTSPPATW